MKRLRPYIKLLIAIGLTVGFLWATTDEYQDTIIYTMPCQVYELIINKLGDNASKRDIVAEYNDNKAYYDSLDWR